MRYGPDREKKKSVIVGVAVPVAKSPVALSRAAVTAATARACHLIGPVLWPGFGHCS